MWMFVSFNDENTVLNGMHMYYTVHVKTYVMTLCFFKAGLECLLIMVTSVAYDYTIRLYFEAC